MNSDLEIPNRVILRLPAPSITNDVSIFHTNESTVKAGKDEYTSLEKDKNESSLLNKEKGQPVTDGNTEEGSNDHSACDGTSARSSLSSFGTGNVNCSPGKHYDNCVVCSEIEEEDDSEDDESDDDSDSTTDEDTEDDSDSVHEDDSESEKSDSSRSDTEMDDEALNEIEDRELVIDRPIDSDGERDKCGMIIVLSRDNAIMVESSIGNLSSEDDNITSDEESVESEEECEVDSDGTSISSEHSECSDTDKSHIECEDESIMEECVNNGSSDDSRSCTDDSASYSDDSKSCANESGNDGSDEISDEDSDDSDDETADKNEDSFTHRYDSQESDDDGSLFIENNDRVIELSHTPKKESDGEMKTRGLSQTDEISIEELEDIINESPKHNDVSEFMMDFSDTEREPPLPPSRKLKKRDYDDSPSNGVCLYPNTQETYFPDNACSPSKTLLKCKRSLSYQLLPSLLSEPSSGSPKRHRSTSTCDSDTYTSEHNVKTHAACFPPLPPLPIAFGTEGISSANLDVRCTQLMPPSDRSIIGERNIFSRFNDRVASTGASVLVSSTDENSTMPIPEWPSKAMPEEAINCEFIERDTTPDSSPQSYFNDLSYSSPARFDNEDHTLTRSSALTPKLEGISLSIH
mmetsp:Transcript_21212/g.26248  ORF Transcript_21212/g.26248 Transcript_21212/m.26248 type:complete len:635 (+) Transcript_21212:1013-2917(+)